MRTNAQRDGRPVGRHILWLQPDRGLPWAHAVLAAAIEDDLSKDTVRES